MKLKVNLDLLNQYEYDYLILFLISSYKEKFGVDFYD